MFVDGTLCEEYNGLYSIAENLPYTSYKVDVYIDLTRIDKSDFDSVEFSSALAPFAKPFGWSIGHQLEKNFRSKNIRFDELDKTYLVSEYYLTQSDALNLMFWDRGIATVVVGAGDSGEQQVNIYDIGRILLKVINENSY